MIDALAALRSGEVIGIPTDTVYGIGADPFNLEAVARLFDLKGRPEHKPVGVLVGNFDQAEEIADIYDEAAHLARTHWPGALTLVVRPKVVMADWVGDKALQTVGVRMPDHPVARELLIEFGPLAVTSANESGGAEAMSHVEARRIFGDRIRVYLEGTAPGGAASTVIDATGARLVVLRKGPVDI
ncbi:MAG: L-threonylcarbamoyladenylate synthase [Acidimicrobiia bacterium]